MVKKLSPLREKFRKAEIRRINLAINGMRRRKQDLERPLTKYVHGRGTLFTGRAKKEIEKVIKFLIKERQNTIKGVF